MDREQIIAAKERADKATEWSWETYRTDTSALARALLRVLDGSEDIYLSARQEAASRYQGDLDADTGATVDDWGYSESERLAFMAGALFAQSCTVRAIQGDQ